MEDTTLGLKESLRCKCKKYTSCNGYDCVTRYIVSVTKAFIYVTFASMPLIIGLNLFFVIAYSMVSTFLLFVIAGPMAFLSFAL